MPPAEATGDDVGQDAEAKAILRLDLGEQRVIDVIGTRRGLRTVVACAAGTGDVPDLLGDAVHVDRQADPAIADQRQTQFLSRTIRRSGPCAAPCDPLSIISL